MCEPELNALIDGFVNTYNNDIKQHDKDWYKLMGTTVGGSEVAAIMGLSPYSSFYKVIESKIEICTGVKSWNASDTLSCWWGTLFEEIVAEIVEIDMGNKVKGTKICIQKYEGHRTSPDGYMIARFYKDNDIYHLWTTDLPEDIISLSIIVLLEFKCPITRKTTENIPKYYKPQVLSGLAVSPLAHKGLFIDSTFKKCSIDHLGNNPLYDISFHKRTSKDIDLSPIAWGTVSIYVSLSKITDEIKEVYNAYFDMEFIEDDDDIIDLGDAPYDIFHKIICLLNNHHLIATKTTVRFADGRGTKQLFDIRKRTNCRVFAILPWKLFDITYIPVDRELCFLENIYPTIQKIHEIVKDSIENNSYERGKIINICNMIYD